jgi:hypothetical protein
MLWLKKDYFAKDSDKKVNLSLQQAAEAYRVLRC